MVVMRDYEFYYTQDGSIGLYSYADNDVYHSKFGALTEAWEKFIIPSGLDEVFKNNNNIKVLDVCYGIGYNTKALMSYIINFNENKILKENFLKKIFKKFKKVSNKNINNETIDNNNPLVEDIELSSSIDTKYDNNFEQFVSCKIDCLDINEELIKISPLLKTLITPQEIYTKFVPRFLDCFDTYWKVKKIISKASHLFAPKNNRNISELLDLKFQNDYDDIESDYRINHFVNYIIIDSLVNKYKRNYINNEFKKLLKEKPNSKFVDKTLLKYARFRQNYGYKLMSKLKLNAFLHNIYYDHLSKRYKIGRLDELEKQFNLNFYIDDARKSILSINEQYDFIFLDAFTFSKAPELWSVEFIAELYNRLSTKGMLLTYSNSALIRKTLLDNNFYVGKIFNEKSKKFIGTVASKDKSLIKYPLTNYEIGLCNTKAGIPYHDYGLCQSKEIILKRREYDFKNSELMTSSQYMKSRSIKNKDDIDEI